MKFNLICWLFGHKFLVKNLVKGINGGQTLVQKRPSSFCIRCGLTKDDIFR